MELVKADRYSYEKSVIFGVGHMIIANELTKDQAFRRKAQIQIKQTAYK